MEKDRLDARDFFPEGKAVRGMRVGVHSFLMPRFRLRGAILLFP